MKGSFSFTLRGVDILDEKISYKVEEITIHASGERSWWDMLLITRFVKKLPKLIKDLYTEAVKIQGI
jgi:hypothetical protein